MDSLGAEWRAAWLQHWPDSMPEADQLRDRFPERWVRFHSLPQSKRYPETDDEYRTVLDRHHAVLDELTNGDAEVLVVTAARDVRPRSHRSGAVVAATTRARRWWSFEGQDSEPGYPLWCSAFVSRMDTSPAALDPLLRLVADDIEEGVIVAPVDFRWLYHPYDGGADVLLATTAERDALRARHQDWLSALPSGL